MGHLHMNRPGYGSGEYYESEQEVIRSTPCDSYSSEYRTQEYGNPGYSVGPHHHHHHHNGGIGERAADAIAYESNPGYYGNRRHGGAAEYVDRREEVIYENGVDPCRRVY